MLINCIASSRYLSGYCSREVTFYFSFMIDIINDFQNLTMEIWTCEPFNRSKYLILFYFVYMFPRLRTEVSFSSLLAQCKPGFWEYMSFSPCLRNQAIFFSATEPLTCASSVRSASSLLLGDNIGRIAELQPGKKNFFSLSLCPSRRSHSFPADGVAPSQ